MSTSAAMLQVPDPAQGRTSISSLQPSQTATLVGPMATELADGSQHELQSAWNDPPEMAMVNSTPASAPASVLPKVPIQFLLGSGKRKVFDFDQSENMGTVRERLMLEWPSEWEGETKPQSASAIRLLHLGRLLSDDESLSDNSRFPARPSPPTVVHLSVRPFPVRNPSTTGSLKAKASLLRTGSAFTFSGRGNNAAPNAGSNNPRAGAGTGGANGNVQTLDAVPEQRESGCCCIIC